MSAWRWIPIGVLCTACSITSEPATNAEAPTTTPPAVATSTPTTTVAPVPTPPTTAAPVTTPQPPPSSTSVATSVASQTVAPTAPPPPPPPPTAPRRITLAFTGDTLPHSPLWREAADDAQVAGLYGFDFSPMFADIAPVISGVDLAVCHLETPIAPIGEELSTAPRYGVPAEIASALAGAGYDRCSTASNHAYDRGSIGIDRTIEALTAASLGQSGMARTPEEIEPHLFEVNGIQIAHLSYTFSYNGLRLPADEEWRSALIDPLRIVGDERRSREMGAEVVIVSLHWGAEGVHEPTRNQRDLAELLTSVGDIDVIVGHHAHVVQPIEQINGSWVLFGLGNILSNLPTSSNWPAASQDAAIVTIAMEVDAAGTVTVEQPVAIPTWVDKDDGFVIRLVEAELARPDLTDGQRARLESSLLRTARILGPYMPSAG